MNVPTELLAHLVSQERPEFVEYSMWFFAGLILINSLPKVIIFGINYDFIIIALIEIF